MTPSIQKAAEGLTGLFDQMKAHQVHWSSHIMGMEADVSEMFRFAFIKQAITTQQLLFDISNEGVCSDLKLVLKGLKTLNGKNIYHAKKNSGEIVRVYVIEDDTAVVLVKADSWLISNIFTFNEQTYNNLNKLLTSGD